MYNVESNLYGMPLQMSTVHSGVACTSTAAPVDASYAGFTDQIDISYSTDFENGVQLGIDQFKSEGTKLEKNLVQLSQMVDKFDFMLGEVIEADNNTAREQVAAKLLESERRLALEQESGQRLTEELAACKRECERQQMLVADADNLLAALKDELQTEIKALHRQLSEVGLTKEKLAEIVRPKCYGNGYYNAHSWDCKGWSLSICTNLIVTRGGEEIMWDKGFL
ncbi:hypothetical protein HDU76_010896 [Blyttiomyces sp. JEL0837]|nr:hypothetical protein HDU76_010896 [Blyttiomyces sp. JEL0837]